MPAATAEKRARQRANRLLQKEAAPDSVPSISSPETVSQPVQPAAANSSPAPIPTSSPATFTISYTPLSISYPKPALPSAQLPTDAIRVTRDDLALMLHQSYLHSVEHGWQMRLEPIQKELQASYEQDMQAAAAKFAEHEKVIHEDAYNLGFEHGIEGAEDHFHEQQEHITSQWEERLLLDCSTARTTGVREECERWESIRVSQIDVCIQVEPPPAVNIVRMFTDACSEMEVSYIPPFTPVSVLIPPAIISLISSLPSIPVHCSPIVNKPPAIHSNTVSSFLSSLFKPLESAITITPGSPAASVPTVELPATPSLPMVWSDEPSDVPLPLPPLPTSTSVSFPARDFLDLRSDTGNPWKSLQHRKGRNRHCTTQTWNRRQRLPQASSLYFLTPPPPISSPHSRRIPTPLDWDHDPRLFELNCILQTLGWILPLTRRR